MHWLVVLVLCAFTFGLAGLAWAFRQAAFVKKIDPSSKGLLYLGLALAAMVLQVILSFMMGRISSSGMAVMLVLILSALNLVIVVFGFLAVFGMRKSLLQHYNAVEPLGLQLGGVMTFFFSIFYFQYHFARIIALKKKPA